jgi:protein-S-isoprenylcysteine O-methyltransferase Ste14
MTTAEQFREAVTRPASTVSIAGVPWPAYKVVALLVGLLVFAVVALATTAAAPAVLSGAGVAALAWLGLGLIGSSNR